MAQKNGGSTIGVSNVGKYLDVRIIDIVGRPTGLKNPDYINVE